MFGLSEKTRWILLFLGLVFVVLGILDKQNMLAEYPLIEFIVFPYIWVVGCALIFVAYGFTDESQKYSGSGGIDGAPGLGEKKRGPFGDGSFWGDGDGSSGGGSD
jgi:hypothetical protein